SEVPSGATDSVSTSPERSWPQQEFPAPEVTRRAAFPYFSLTISLTFSVLIFKFLSLLADGENLPRLDGLISGATFRVQKSKKSLEGVRVGRIPEEGSLPAHM